MPQSNDMLAQSLLAQLRQRPQQSSQARMAEQMMQQAGASRPIYNGGAGIAMQGIQGLLAGFMANRAEASDRERQDNQMAFAEKTQNQRDERADSAFQAARGGGMPPPMMQQPPQPGMGMQPAMQPAVVREPMPPMPGEGGGDAMAGSEARYASVPGRPPLGASYREPVWAAGLPRANGQMNANLGGDPAGMHPMPGAPDANMLRQRIQALSALNDPRATRQMQIDMQELGRLETQRERREDRQFALDNRAPRAPSEFDRLITSAGLQPGSPEAQAFARSQLERRGAAPSTNVNVDSRQMGTIPPGFRAEYDEAGRIVQLVPIPGGPASLDADKTEAAAVSRRAGTARSVSVVTQDIDRALGRLDQAFLPVTGFGAATLAGIAGTGAADVRALLESVRANTGFAALSQMRSESPTGAALGAITERELSLLQSVLGSLEQSQSPTQFRENLVRLRQIYVEIINGAAAPVGRPAAPGATPSVTPRNGGLIQRAQDRNAGTPGRLRFNPATGDFE